jgi:hypothetical protein
MIIISDAWRSTSNIDFTEIEDIFLREQLSFKVILDQSIVETNFNNLFLRAFKGEISVGMEEPNDFVYRYLINMAEIIDDSDGFENRDSYTIVISKTHKTLHLLRFRQVKSQSIWSWFQTKPTMFYRLDCRAYDVMAKPKNLLKMQ